MTAALCTNRPTAAATVIQTKRITPSMARSANSGFPETSRGTTGEICQRAEKLSPSSQSSERYQATTNTVREMPKPVFVVSSIALPLIKHKLIQ